MTEPRIRPARAEDLDAALQLFADLDRHQREWRVFPPRRSLRHEAAERYRRALDDPAIRHAVAVEGHHLVGMALGEIVAGSSFSDERALEISSILVLEARRGQGIGRALVADLVAFGRERDGARGRPGVRPERGCRAVLGVARAGGPSRAADGHDRDRGGPPRGRLAAPGRMIFNGRGLPGASERPGDRE